MMKFGLYKVTGDSMWPNYCSGDYVLAFRHHASTFKVGDVVVARHTRFGNIIKRIERVEDNSTLAIAGDNRLSSTDSDTLGLVSTNQILGKVLWHIAAIGTQRSISS